MNFIGIHIRSGIFFCNTPNLPDIVKKKQGGVFLQILRLFSSMESYKKVLTPQRQLNFC